MRSKHVPDEILAFKQKIEHWRNTRSYKSPMPKPLWDEAVDLSRRFTANQVVKATSISSNQLYKRLQQISPRSDKKAIPSDKTNSFVAVDLPAPSVPETISIELENSDGKILRLKGQFDVNEVIAKFMG